MLEIVRNNNNTFYNYDTGAKKHIRYRISIFVFLSFILCFFLKNPTDGFLSAILTVQSILVGFSFNVLFFLTSSSDEFKNSSIIEVDLLHAKIERLKRELFYNISYFIMISVICILSSLIIIIPAVDVAVTVPVRGFLGGGICNIADKVSSAFWYFVYFLLYFSTVEGIYTFARTTYRVVFLFNKKMAQNSQSC